MNNTVYFEKLVASVTRIARHAYYPGKEEAIEDCLEELHDLEHAGRITPEQRDALREVLLGDESECLVEGLLRERRRDEPAPARDRIAVYCEGVGSQAAFAAGVLRGLLRRDDLAPEVAALGGVSWGAVCSVLAWDGLLRGDPAGASAQLAAFWEDYAAHTLVETLLNYSAQMAAHVRALAALSGFRTGHALFGTAAPLRRLLERRIDLDRARGLAERRGAPGLAVAALDSEGSFHVCRGEEISLDAMADVAWLPRPLPGSESNRPRRLGALPAATSPIRALLAFAPTELWLIQVNRTPREVGPGPLDGPLDGQEWISRLLLEQEIRFVHAINTLLRRGTLIDSDYRHVEVHRIIMDHDLDETSALDRSPGFLGGLMSYGEERLRQFLEKRALGKSQRPLAKARR